MPYDRFKHHPTGAQGSRRSIRLKGYDYSQVGAYFITICVQNRECIFGEIANNEMHVNQFGQIMLKWWNELPNYYSPVTLDEFVVMPNHIHGIIVITEDVGAGSPRPNADSAPGANAGAGLPRPNTNGAAGANVGAGLSRLNTKRTTKNRTLGQLVGYYKFEATKEINQIRDTAYAKALQRDYYEHIIRNDREWDAIAKYIRDNPANWCSDLDNPSLALPLVRGRNGWGRRSPPKDRRRLLA